MSSRHLNWALGMFLAWAGCASGAPAAPETTTAPAVPPALVAPPKLPAPPPVLVSAVARGELPWWHALESGVYELDGRRLVLAIGRSAEHHHVAEGFLKARVSARLAVRRVTEGIGFNGTFPQPVLSDLFITRDRKFLALYELEIPSEAALPPGIEPLKPPKLGTARHRIGRHVFEDGRHSFLDCEVEGPIANPDWGRDRATAWLNQK